MDRSADIGVVPWDWGNENFVIVDTTMGMTLVYSNSIIPKEEVLRFMQDL